MIINSAYQAPKLIDLDTKTSHLPVKMSGTELAGSFSDMLKGALESLNAQQQEVTRLNEAFMKGEITDIHTLLIASEKAHLGLELTVQVRNKVIEAYQEIMRIQI